MKILFCQGDYFWGKQKQGGKVWKQQTGVPKIGQRKDKRQAGKTAGSAAKQKQKSVAGDCPFAVWKQEFNTALSVQAKADNRGESKQRNRQGQKLSARFAHHQNKGVFGRIGRKGNAAAQNGKGGSGADKQSVAEYLKDTPKSLFYRGIVAASVSDGGAAQSRFVGKNSPGNTYPHRNKEPRGNSGSFAKQLTLSECLRKDLMKGGGQIFPKVKDNHKAACQVEYGHKGNQSGTQPHCTVASSAQNPGAYGG